MIVTMVHSCLNSEESHRLAEALVGALELHRHVLNSAVADLRKLASLWEPEQIEDFCKLHEAGFQFYYLPNA